MRRRSTVVPRCLRSLRSVIAVMAVVSIGGLVLPARGHAANSGSVRATPVRQIYGLDCEAAALQIALGAVGVNVSQDWLLQQFGDDPRAPVLSGGEPVRWGDPYQAFVGNVRGVWLRTGYGVYYPRIVAGAEAAGANAIGHEGWSPSDLYAQVAAGNPVVVRVPHLLHTDSVKYWTAWDGRNVWYSPQDHAQVLIGFDYTAQTVTLADPADGQIHTYPMPLFESRFADFMGQAIVVQARSPRTLGPVSWGPGHTDVFWTGTDGALWHYWLGGNTWYGPQSLGAPTLGSDPQPVAISPGHMKVFWRGLDGSVWYMSYDNGWEAAQLIQGTTPIGGPPIPVVVGGVVSVFWRGADSTLWEVTSTGPGTWTGPVSRGGSMASDPVPISLGTNQTDVFWKGTDGAIWHSDNASGSWHPPVALASGAVDSEPSVTSSATGIADVFWRGLDGNLWHIAGGASWPRGPTYAAAGPLGSVPHAISAAANAEDVFWKGADGNLWHVTSTNQGASWQGPSSLGGGTLGGDPTPVTWGGGYIDVLWPGGYASLWHNVLNGSWSGTLLIGDRP